MADQPIKTGLARRSRGVFVVALLLIVLQTLVVARSRRAEFVAPPIGAFVTVDRQRLHVVDRGPRASTHPPVVLIHGSSANLRDMNIALGDPLSTERRVVAVDRPGRGYSTRPRDGYRLDVQARLIHDAVTALGVEQPIIVGQSLGGAVALAYALQFQEEMSALVVLAPVSHEWPGGVDWYNHVSGWPFIGQAFNRIVIPFYGPWAARRTIDASFEGGPPDDYYQRSGTGLLFRPADFAHNASDLRHLKSQIREMQRRYPELTVPTTIVAGAADGAVSPKIHSEALAADVRHAAFDLLPNAGHALHHTRTADILDAIRAAPAERR